MMILRKTKDIAILKSMGANTGSIIQIFLMNGLIIGAVGTSLGTLGGLILCELLKKYQFIKIPKDIYYLDTLPVQIEGLDILFIVTAALAITIIASVYPSWKAARQDPVEAIRYE
jgi:lipoprotein-releasing system permease protein